MIAEIYNNIHFYRVNNDVNGNPRYVVHFLDFIKEDENINDVLKEYQIAKARAKKCGFREFRNKSFGGGFVTTCYDLNYKSNQINDLLNSL